MEMSPQRVRSAEFKTARKGADLDEVQQFLNDVADELERAQNQSTAMEARARAAVARLQEMTDEPKSAAPQAAAPAVTVPDVSVDEAETISRTLLLAQRTADSTVAEARGEAARIVQAANAEATTTLDSAREMSTRLVDEARAGARQAGEAERITVAGEVDALKARRDFLESDVEQLELFLTDQRSRLREAATSLLDIVERVPGGLGAARVPLLSASDDDHEQSGSRRDVASVDEVEAPVVAVEASPAAEPTAPADELLIVADLSDASNGPDADSEPTIADSSGDPTQAMPVVSLPGDPSESAPPSTDTRNDDILFSFDDDRR